MKNNENNCVNITFNKDHEYIHHITCDENACTNSIKIFKNDSESFSLVTSVKSQHNNAIVRCVVCPLISEKFTIFSTISDDNTIGIWLFNKNTEIINFSKSNPLINNLCNLTAILRDSRTSIISCVFIIDYDSDTSNKDNDNKGSSKNMNSNEGLCLDKSENGSDNLNTGKSGDSNGVNNNGGKLSLNTNYNNISLMVLHKNGYIRIYLCQDSPNFIIWSIIEQFPCNLNKNVTSCSYINNLMLINNKINNVYLIALGTDDGTITIIGKFTQLNTDYDQNLNYDFDYYFNNEIENSFNNIVDNSDEVIEFNNVNQNNEYMLYCSNWETLYSTEEYNSLNDCENNLNLSELRVNDFQNIVSQSRAYSNYNANSSNNANFNSSSNNNTNTLSRKNNRKNGKRSIDDSEDDDNSNYKNNNTDENNEHDIEINPEGNNGQEQNNDNYNNHNSYNDRNSDRNVISNQNPNLILNCVLDLSWCPNYCREYDILVSSFDIYNYNENYYTYTSDVVENTHKLNDNISKKSNKNNVLIKKVNGLPWIGIWKWSIQLNNNDTDNNALSGSDGNLKDNFNDKNVSSNNLHLNNYNFKGLGKESRGQLELIYCILNSDICDPIMSIIWDVKGTEFIACSKNNITRYVQKYNYSKNYISVNSDNYFFYLGENSRSEDNNGKEFDLECFDNYHYYISNFPLFVKCADTI
ncbi:hypothetical protein FG379_001565 [Cryptosporidium bovis]|uniref:uncharacterized protein n=1 Tax=Cryptosporidium bovis TaxID=310047 RepID=UPI00351A00D5|nr:hypothetical protein FG379_001565 [Cryptosporidium bovis]